MPTYMPTAQTQEWEQLQRRRKIAEALQARSMQPLETNQMAGGYVVPVSPLSGVAKLVEAFGSRKAMNDLDTREKDMLEGWNRERSSTVQRA